MSPSGDALNTRPAVRLLRTKTRAQAHTTPACPPAATALHPSGQAPNLPQGPRPQEQQQGRDRRNPTPCWVPRAPSRPCFPWGSGLRPEGAGPQGIQLHSGLTLGLGPLTTLPVPRFFLGVHCRGLAAISTSFPTLIRGPHNQLREKEERRRRPIDWAESSLARQSSPEAVAAGLGSHSGECAFTALRHRLSWGPGHGQWSRTPGCHPFTQPLCQSPSPPYSCAPPQVQVTASGSSSRHQLTGAHTPVGPEGSYSSSSTAK